MDPATRFPPKLISKIENLEFVEIADLLQEAWASDATDSNNQTLKHLSRQPPVSDIQVWAECYMVMAAVLSCKYPAKAPELFAYARRIFHAARIYDNHAWVTYDRIYRRQAATRHSLDWSVEDQSLDNEVFAGWAKQSTRCKYCLGENHTVEACPEMPLVQLPVSLVPTTPASLSGSVLNRPSLTQQPNARSGEVCRKYNEDRCFFR